LSLLGLTECSFLPGAAGLRLVFRLNFASIFNKPLGLTTLVLDKSFGFLASVKTGFFFCCAEDGVGLVNNTLPVVDDVLLFVIKLLLILGVCVLSPFKRLSCVDSLSIFRIKDVDFLIPVLPFGIGGFLTLSLARILVFELLCLTLVNSLLFTIFLPIALLLLLFVILLIIAALGVSPLLPLLGVGKRDWCL
jgi:hypothetical protein